MLYLIVITSTPSMIAPEAEVMFSVASLCLCVCISGSKITQEILTQFAPTLEELCKVQRGRMVVVLIQSGP